MKAAAVIAFTALALLGCADDGGPPKPYNLTADSAGGAAVLRWGYKASPDLDSFIIQRSEGFNNNFADLAKTPPNKLDYFDGGVAVGETYYYRVAAVYAEWNGEKYVRSGYSAEVSVEIE